MEAVRGLVSRTLPLLPLEILDKVTERLEEVGVSQKEDLHLVTAEDLEGVLKPLHCRKLIKAFSSSVFELGLEDETEPSNGSDMIQLQLVQPDVLSFPPSWGGLFQIPLHKLPNELVKALAEKKRPTPALRREMVRIVVDDVFACEGRPSRLRLRQVAQQIVEQYPKSFSDVSGDIVVGKGYESLMLQLQNRVDNCLRSSMPIIKQQGQRARKRQRFSEKYGCAKWQPSFPDDADIQERKRIELCNAYNENMLPDLRIRQLMKDTYCSQRLDFNNRENSVSLLMEKWPYSFESAVLFDHCEILLGFSVQLKFAEELSKQGQVVINFINATSEITSNVEKKVGALDLLQCLAGYFKEDADILLIRNQKELPKTPCIIVIDESSFKVAVDETVTTATFHCPTVAVSYLFGMFYMLNIKYPKEAALTLEFIQRGFLGINPPRGSKSEPKGKKQYCIHPKLLKFLSDLNDFQNRGEI